MDCIEPNDASDEYLSLFHSQFYLNYLKSLKSGTIPAEDTSFDGSNDSDDTNESVDDEQLNYGLGYDCPRFRGLWKFVKVIAGASATAANLILDDRKVVINWCGGWHHAQRSGLFI